MRAIIPAAGLGTRLLPFTRDNSKALLPVRGRPLLSYTLQWLAEGGVDEVIVVLGHCGGQLRNSILGLKQRPRVQFVENEDYQSTNSIVSLALTLRFWGNQVVVIDSDVLATPELIRTLLTPGESALVIDNTRSHDVADMKVEVRENSVWHLDKGLPAARHHGEFFGLSRWKGAAMDNFAATLEDYVARGDRDVWYEFAIRDVAKRVPIGVIATDSDSWAEVDRNEDLETAEQLIDRVAEKAHG